MEGDTRSNIFMRSVKAFFSFINVEYTFVNLMVMFASILLLKFCLVALQQYLARLMSASIIQELRVKAFDNLMHLPLSYYYKSKTGDIAATLFTSCNKAGAVVEAFIQLLADLLFLCIYLAVNVMISFVLTLVTCLIAAISYCFVIPKFKIGFDQGGEEKGITDSISSFILDKLGGIKTVKSFNNERLHSRGFRDLSAAFCRIQVNIQKNRILTDIYIEPFITMLVIGLMVFSITVLKLPIIYVLTFFYVFTRTIPKVKTINGTYLTIMNLLPHFSKAQELIDRHDKYYLPEGNRELKAFKQGIELQDVSFRYVADEEDVVRHVSLSIEKGVTLALIGRSGGGKTTLVDLILRHHDPSKGTIRVDGMDLKEACREDWNGMIAMVEQDSYLFNDSIFENIRYGKLDATEDEVFEASRLANAHDFIMSLPDKYHTIAGDRGIKLSGGQKQRISLARALIRDPEILILDEATSALDSESERLIQDSIEKLKKRKTLIIIAHRLSTISRADKIVMIENGEITEAGSHEELMKEGRAYKKTYLLQQEAFKERSNEDRAECTAIL